MGRQTSILIVLSKRATLAKNIIFTFVETDMVHEHKDTSNLSSGEEI